MANKSPKIHSGTETKTKKQWLKEGRLLKEGAVGERLYTNGFCQISAVYYKIEETYEATAEEIRTIREPELAKKREYARQKRKIQKAIKFRETELQKAAEQPSIPCTNPSKLVVFDVETTGLNPYEDEVLQLSIIDGDENILFSSYIKPYLHNSWAAAERIHGITPEMVKKAPYMHEVLPVIRGIFESAQFLVTYNGVFDESFLEEYRIDLRLFPEIDVMDVFAQIYGAWDEYHGNYKWQKLSTCASYYGYKFKAHDSLEDAKATLYCYKQMMADSEIFEKYLK